MTQAVPTEGFNSGLIQNTPPANQQPGFVVPPAGNAPDQVPATPAQQAQAPQGNDALASAIAALTQALGTQVTPVEPAAQAAPAIQGVPQNLNEFDVSSLDDPIMRSMATVMQTVGKDLDMDRAIGKALANGRVDLIDVAYITEKGGANAQQLITIAQGLVQAVEAKSAAATAKVYAMAGGQQQWDAGIAAFNSGAPQELRVVVGQMLDSGKDNLIDAGAKIIVEFSKNSGLLPQNKPLLQQGAASAVAAQALDKVGFQAELRKLNPNERGFEAARAELFARRQAGKNLGM